METPEPTPEPDERELDERKASVLRAIVEEYVETAQPVGSQTVARASDLGVSSATIRNDMTLLEREGYITQPHTSAGRIPTDRGYRYFVDHFTQKGPLPPQQHRAVADFFETSHRALEDLLHETSQLLARLSRHAAVVVGPQPDQAVVRGAQIVRLHERSALLVVVLSNGTIERHVLTIDEEADDSQLATAARAVEVALLDRPWGTLPEIAPTGDPVADRVIADARSGLAALATPDHHEPLYVGGVSNLAAEQEAFSTAQSAARLLEMLEHQVVVVSVVHELLQAGLTVRIGSEHQLAELRECALVLAPYEVDGQAAGVVGVLGPTRMDYRHALSAVSAVSQQLGRHLS
ncbi:MAG: heat-inducible transcriptional repressor HrcA [Actinomycetota bacterium]